MKAPVVASSTSTTTTTTTIDELQWFVREEGVTCDWHFASVGSWSRGARLQKLDTLYFPNSPVTGGNGITSYQLYPVEPVGGRLYRPPALPAHRIERTLARDRHAGMLRRNATLSYISSDILGHP